MLSYIFNINKYFIFIYVMQEIKLGPLVLLDKCYTNERYLQP